MVDNKNNNIIAFDRDKALMYHTRKKRRKKALITAMISSVGLLILILVALSLIHVDRFTITTDSKNELVLTVKEDKSEETTKLIAPPLLKAMDTQYTDIPETIDEGLGSKNTYYYFAYSFYLGARSSNESINYSMNMELKESSKELENAIRVMIIRNGVKNIYAKADDEGNPKLIYSGSDHNEPEQIIGSTIPFKENRHIILEPYKIKSGTYDRFTVVMWIDGWESIDSMKNGEVHMDLNFSTISMNNLEGE